MTYISQVDLACKSHSYSLLAADLHLVSKFGALHLKLPSSSCRHFSSASETGVPSHQTELYMGLQQRSCIFESQSRSAMISGHQPGPQDEASPNQQTSKPLVDTLFQLVDRLWIHAVDDKYVQGYYRPTTHFQIAQRYGHQPPECSLCIWQMERSARQE